MNKEKTVELFSFTSSNGIYIFILEENMKGDLEEYLGITSCINRE